MKNLPNRGSLPPFDKAKLLEMCHELIDQKIKVLEDAIVDANTTAKEDSKSSAGDKYETTRAMMHLEIEKHQRQLEEAVKSRRILKSIVLNRSYEAVELGACVQTDDHLYFMAISGGQMNINGLEVLVISPLAPIGQGMLGRVAGDSFQFMNKEQVIRQVF